MSEYLLGIDNGGTVTKATIYTAEGKEIATASEKTQLIMPKPGFTERDLPELWAANCRSIRGVIEKSSIKPSDIAAVASTGHGNGIYLVDDELNPVGNGIISTDTRAKEYVKNWYSDGTFQKILPKTMQSIWAGQPVALLAWMNDNEPETVRKTRWVLMCKDYIRLRLTGEPYAEITDMTGTSFMNVGTAEYDEEVLDAFGLSAIRSKLPDVKGAADVCGSVSAEAAGETGLAEGTPVAGGLFDINACAIATGIIDDSKLCCIAGTWSINEYISREPVVAEDHFMTTLYCIPGYYLIGDSSPTSASNLEWFVTNFIESLAPGKGNVYNACNDTVESVQPEDSSVIFLPFLYGSNAGPDASAGFVGLNGYHTTGHLLRAVYEGVAFGTKVHLNRLARYRVLPNTARVSGGAAKSKVWMQMFADVLQKRIEITENEELGTLGAALCAGVSVGVFDTFEAGTDKMVRTKHCFEPDKDADGIYTEKFKKYEETVEALQNVWPY